MMNEKEHGKEGVKIAVVLVAALLLFLLSIAAVAAAPPSTLGIQGRLINSTTGEALVGSYSVSFDIYNVKTGGSALFTQVQTVNTDVNGLYSVVMNGVTATFGEQYWLGVDVASDGEMTPRLNFTAAPYAFNALNLTCTDCLNADEIEDIYVLIAGDTMGGNLDMGTHSLTSVGGISLGNGATISTAGTNVIIDDPLQVNGNILLNGNWLSYDGGSEGVYVTTGGNVGIGVSTPDARFVIMNKTAPQFKLAYDQVTGTSNGAEFSIDSGYNLTIQAIRREPSEVATKMHLNPLGGIVTTGSDLIVSGDVNVSGTDNCVYIPGGGKLCGNSTCSMLYSPEGNTILEACN